jgi:hypothetical protein
MLEFRQLAGLTVLTVLTVEEMRREDARKRMREGAHT